MKNIIFILLVLFLVGCNNDDDYFVTEVYELPKEKTSLFDGYFYLNGAANNCIYLHRKENGLVDVESECQSLVSLNPRNRTYGQFPRVTINNVMVMNDEIRFTKNLNFSSSKSDIEEDQSGNDINGKKRVDFLLKYNNDGRLTMNIKVFKSNNNNNLNYIIVNRTFTEL